MSVISWEDEDSNNIRASDLDIITDTFGIHTYVTKEEHMTNNNQQNIPGVVGLYGFQSSFLSALLQLLFRIPTLTEMLLYEQVADEISSVIYTPIISQLERLFALLAFSQHSAIDGREVLQSIGSSDSLSQLDKNNDNFEILLTEILNSLPFNTLRSLQFHVKTGHGSQYRTFLDIDLSQTNASSSETLCAVFVSSIQKYLSNNFGDDSSVVGPLPSALFIRVKIMENYNRLPLSLELGFLISEDIVNIFILHGIVLVNKVGHYKYVCRTRDKRWCVIDGCISLIIEESGICGDNGFIPLICLYLDDSKILQYDYNNVKSYLKTFIADNQALFETSMFNHPDISNKLSQGVSGDADNLSTGNMTVLASGFDVIDNHTTTFTTIAPSRGKFVGLCNQGATCYLNSLLQTLFHNLLLRKSVFSISLPNPKDSLSSLQSDTNGTLVSDSDHVNTITALQRLFYCMQVETKSVDTEELTKAFGWSASDIYMQHDVQELNRVLIDVMENQMKGTISEDAIEKMFVGKTRNFVRCLNVTYESSRIESFYDISLNVKGINNVIDAFVDYVKLEVLNGDNQYLAESYGLQDAEKGILFTALPTVLYLQLKRFEYDPVEDNMVKVNDRFEFYDEINLEPFLENESKDDSIYVLQSVLVYQGQMHGGHYFAYIRPDYADNTWYFFDDQTVSVVSKETAISGNFGTNKTNNSSVDDWWNTSYGSYYTYGPHYPSSKMHDHSYGSSAYMLVYVKKSAVPTVMSYWNDDCDDGVIPIDLKHRVRRTAELAEIRRQEEIDQKHRLTILLATDSHIRDVTRKNSRKDGGISNFESSSMISLLVSKNDSYDQVLCRLQDLGLITGQFSWWVILNNVLKPIDFHEGDTLNNLDYYSSIISVYIKSPHDLSTTEIDLNRSTSCSELKTLLFFKLYNPYSGQLLFMGSFVVDDEWKCSDITDLLTVWYCKLQSDNPVGSHLPNITDGFEFVMYRRLEIYGTPSVARRINSDDSFTSLRVRDGDVIFVELVDESVDNDDRFLPNFPDFFQFIQNRVEVRFASYSDSASDTFVLTLSIHESYASVREHVASELAILESARESIYHSKADTGFESSFVRSIKPDFIRFFAHCNYSSTLVGDPLDSTLFPTLHDMLSSKGMLPDVKIFYYQILNRPLSEVEQSTTFNIMLTRLPKSDINLCITLLKKSTIKDMVEAIMSDKMAGLCENEQIRIIECSCAKIVRVLSSTDCLSDISHNSVIRAEVMCDDDRNEYPGDVLVTVAHYVRGSYWSFSAFGTPFTIVIKCLETTGELKERIRCRLDVDVETASKWDLSFLYYGTPVILNNDDIVLRSHSFSTNSNCLRIEHPSSEKSKLPAQSGSFSTDQRGIVIRN